jgi:predicted lipoprotein with Yx(FWY)xxD motif
MRLRTTTMAMAITGAAALAGVLVAGSPVQAAKKPAPTIKTVNNSDVGKKILVDSKGRTVYILTGEKKGKYLCTSSQCLAAWPMVTVKSASTKLVKGPGVSGKLGTVKRGSKYQVTLGGKPLYLYASDSKGDASGQGLKSFGGTWLVLSSSGKAISDGGSGGSTGGGSSDPGYGY